MTRLPIGRAPLSKITLRAAVKLNGNAAEVTCRRSLVHLLTFELFYVTLTVLATVATRYVPVVGGRLENAIKL